MIYLTLLALLALLMIILSSCGATITVGLDDNIVIAGFVGSALRAVGGFVGNNLMGIGTQLGQVAHDRSMQERGFSHAHDMMTRQQEWEHPVAKKQRLLEAGINPKLAFGDAASGGTAGQALQSDARGQKLQRAMERLELQSKREQNRNLVADRRIKEEEARNKGYTRRLIASQAGQADTQTTLNKEQVDLVRQQARAAHWQGGLSSRQMAMVEQELNFHDRTGMFHNQPAMNALLAQIFERMTPRQRSIMSGATIGVGGIAGLSGLVGLGSKLWPLLKAKQAIGFLGR